VAERIWFADAPQDWQTTQKKNAYPNGDVPEGSSYSRNDGEKQGISAYEGSFWDPGRLSSMQIGMKILVAHGRTRFNINILRFLIPRATK
jgi:hypothetical protein